VIGTRGAAAPGQEADLAAKWESAAAEYDDDLGPDSPQAETLRRCAAELAAAQPAPFSDGVHVDWHMTPGEWRQLCTVFWEHAEDTPYIGRLIEAGKVPPSFATPQAAIAAQPQPAPGDVGYLGSDALAKRYGDALQRIVDVVTDMDAVDKLARNALGLTRVGKPSSRVKPAPEVAAAMARLADELETEADEDIRLSSSHPDGTSRVILAKLADCLRSTAARIRAGLPS